jgi:hypothetical protein
MRARRVILIDNDVAIAGHAPTSLAHENLFAQRKML